MNSWFLFVLKKSGFLSVFILYFKEDENDGKEKFAYQNYVLYGEIFMRFF